jgi:hypothetical protein
VLDGTEVVADMQVTGGLDAGKDALFHIFNFLLDKTRRPPASVLHL